MKEYYCRCFEAQCCNQNNLLHLLGDPKELIPQSISRWVLTVRLETKVSSRIETSTTIQGCAACDKIQTSEEWHDYVKQLHMMKQQCVILSI
jgi:hypothetical protein